MKTASTIHGTGTVITENYKLKTKQSGWLKAFRFADQDFHINLKAGTVVTLLKHNENDYSFFIEGKMKDFGFNLFKENHVRFESDLMQVIEIPYEVRAMLRKYNFKSDEFLSIISDVEDIDNAAENLNILEEFLGDYIENEQRMENMWS